MIRFQGAAHGPINRVAVIANDALGNFAAATPLLQKLRSDWDVQHVLYVGGRRTREFQSMFSLIDESIDLFSTSIPEAIQELSARTGSFDVVINLESSDLARTAAALLAGDHGAVCGPCIGPDGRGVLEPPVGEPGQLLVDRGWASPDLPHRYQCLDSGFIGEIFVRLCGMSGPVPRVKLPSEPAAGDFPDVFFSCSASLPEKLWPTERWLSLARQINDAGYTIGIMGAPVKAQAAFWKGGDSESELIAAGLAQDMRGKWTLPQCVDALGKAQFAVCIDNGVGHMAAAAGTPRSVIFRDKIHYLWAPPGSPATVVHPEPGCLPASIPVSQVWKSFQSQLTAKAHG